MAGIERNSPASGLTPGIFDALRAGAVIPAHPLALNSRRKLDERRQTALSRYYCEAGAGGLAVGVHTTQFAIRDPKIGLYEPVLCLALEVMRAYEERSGKHLIRVAGVCGRTTQAVKEATVARGIGYHLALLSLGAMKDAGNDELLEHCRQVSAVIPLFGFYLQPAVGGRVLPYSFWRRFLEIENVCAVKVAPFHRYQTLDVVRALAESGRLGEVFLYTGNDDSILVDLLSDFRLKQDEEEVTVRFAGGLLGHWAVWTRKAVELLHQVQQCRSRGGEGAFELLASSAAITDANAAFFDAANNFAGCIAGIHEVLHRQGLLAGRWCIDPQEDLSPGQMEEIDRVCRSYPHLSDDEFVRQNLDCWLS